MGRTQPGRTRTLAAPEGTAIEQYICVHGHFYQPYREHPWLEEVEEEDSAHPFHDWNERVARECYAPNGAARLLDDKGRIVGIVSNYERISADFGPTLLSWLERSQPEIHRAIVEDDRASRARFSGHGAAIAQMYNHSIAPLDNLRDRRTQALWGLADFEHRFGRKSEGMWLPETAVDIPTLDILSEFGVKFVVLAPHQARAFRSLGETAWQDAQGRLDPKSAYLCRLPSGRSLAAFFYDGIVAKDVAFGPLLDDGRVLAGRLKAALGGGSERPVLEHIAVDGETFGHHHRFGDMALASCLHEIENSPAHLTVYGEFLERFPPDTEVAINENTSWSCVHGIERWRADCGCNSGSHPDWNQKWRAPLRTAMDWLRDQLDAVYEREAARLVRDPWQARDDYIAVILDRSSAGIERFVAGHAVQALSKDETTRLLKLLELERFAMLMYSSDGWFFDDISELTTIQVLKCAARAIQLCREVGGQDCEPEYVTRLASAVSNVPEQADGARIYASQVKPAAVDMPRIAAHFAMASLFIQKPSDRKPMTRLGRFSAAEVERRQTEVGSQKLAFGKLRVASATTAEQSLLAYTVLHFGGHHLSAWVCPCNDDAALASTGDKASAAFLWGDVAEVIRVIEAHFGPKGYTFGHVLRDGQRGILSRVINEAVAWLEPMLEDGLDRCYSSARAMREVNMNPARAVAIPLASMLNTAFRRQLEHSALDLGRLELLAREFRPGVLEPNRDELAPAASLTIERLLAALAKNAAGAGGEPLSQAARLFDVLDGLGLPLDLWKSQNRFFPLVASVYPELRRQAESGDRQAKESLSRFERLSAYLGFRI